MSPALIAVGFAQLALLAALGWWPGARATPFPALALLGGAFALHLAAAFLQSRRPASRAVLWGGGALMRAVLLPLPPHYSDDVWRYLWDGWVQLQGVNPYAHPPAAPALEPLRTAWHTLVNHPEIPTIYPPGAQLAFLALAALGPSVLLTKLAWVVADLGVAAVLDRLTPRPSGTASPALVLWLWSPLVIVEVAWSGHLEPLGILPMMGAVWLARRASARPGAKGGDLDGGAPSDGWRDRRAPALWAGALLGIGGAVKLAPLAALPALWRRRGAMAVLGAAAALLVVAVPYLGAGPAALTEGLRTYAARWSFHPGLFRLLEAALGDGGARAAAAAAVIGIALTATWRGWSLDRTLLWTLGAALLLSPTLHPWYVLWVLPLAALRGSGAWVLLAGTVFLAYAGLDAFRSTGRWPQPGWIALLIHAPVLLWLALEGLRTLTPTARPPDGAARRAQVAEREQAGEREGR